MANIVELRALDEEALEELLENAREELFNLRFQKAAGTLEDVSRLKFVRREIAQVQEVLRKRELAVEAAAAHGDIAAVLDGKNWSGSANFQYEDGGWAVTLSDDDGNELATALVDLNRKVVKTRRARGQGISPRVVREYNIAGK